MNNVLTKNEAANDRLAQLVKRSIVACVLACTAAGAMAAGQDRSPRREEMQQQNTRERYDSRAQDPRYDQRAYEMREDARRQQEQAMRDQVRDEGRRGSARMTPDERSDLRRQINEANRDLYPNARRR